MNTSKIARILTAGGFASGLALASLLSVSPAALADQPQPQEITVTAVDLAYSPNLVLLTVGQPVRLTIKNDGALDHDIKSDIPVADFAYVQADNDLQEQQDNAAGNVFDIDFNKGDTAEVTFTPTVSGSYPFQCDEPGHADAGMTGMFVVVPADNAPAEAIYLA